MAGEPIGPGMTGGSTAAVETTDNDDRRAAITVRGELDAAIAPALRAELARHLDAGCRVLRIDVSAVTFIDSTVLGEFIFASERCFRDRGSLILTNVPPKVRRIVEIAGLEALLLIDTADEGPISGP